MNLLLLTEKDRVAGEIFRVGGRRAEHIKCVLRAKVGDTVRAGLLGGNLGNAELRKVERTCAELSCPAFPGSESPGSDNPESPPIRFKWL